MAQRMASTEPELELDIVPVDYLAALPFYNADLEDPSLTPEVVKDWRFSVLACDGLFIASPEYNFGPTALIKNAIDWVSRPPGQHALSNKVVTLLSSSASTGGKHMSEQISYVLTILGNTLVVDPPALFVKGAERIAPDGTTVDPDVETAVRTRLTGLRDALVSRP